MKRIGFVILTWNSQKVIANCIDSISALDSGEIISQVVIVDNGSSDDTKMIIKDKQNKYAQKFDLSLIELEQNFGTTISRNKGIVELKNRNVKSDYLCVLDSDTQVNTESLLRLVDELEKNPKCGIVGPKMHDSNGVYQRSGRQIPTFTEKLLKVLPVKALQEKGLMQETVIQENGFGCIKVGYLMSACWMMRMSLTDEIGLLDEKIFYAPEDVDYCIATQKAGYDIEYCYDADILHEWQRLSRKKLISKHNWEHIKGLIYMFMKYRYVFNADKLFIKGSN